MMNKFGNNIICIYKIENTINGKLYIGKTKNYKKRVQSHLCALRKKRASHLLQRAWNKYGELSFCFSIIEIVEFEELDSREKFWISEYNANSEGYNLESGGVSGKYLNKSTKDLMAINNPRYWKNKKGVNHNTSKCVYQYSLQGEYIQAFGNAYEAAEKIGMSQKIIQSSAKGRQIRGGNYLWSYLKVDKLVPYKRYTPDNAPHSRPVQMLDISTKKIFRSFGSAQSAENYLKKGKNKISSVCRGTRLSWAGYAWQYKK